MLSRSDYVTEIRKFTTSQYWNSGVRITAGVMIPMLVMIYCNWLSAGIPFLFGALFVSLTDTPGPIHHRRNGMLAAVALNSLAVAIVTLSRDHTWLLIAEVACFSFVFSFIGIYGARAGAVGTLALVTMLISMSPLREQGPGVTTLLTAAGGLWYAVFSIVLYRLQPYRLVEQALGENLIQVAAYVRARAAFYKHAVNIDEAFNRVMKEQVEVLRTQEQLRDLIFRTRQIALDASPKSRSIMMIFLEAIELFEEAMYSYQDYRTLHRHISLTLLQKFYRVILEVVAEIEMIGLAVQSGYTVKRLPELDSRLKALSNDVEKERAQQDSEKAASVHALEKTVHNLNGMIGRLNNIVQYTRLETADLKKPVDTAQVRNQSSPGFTLSLLRENLTLRSNHFRYSLRLTLAMLGGWVVSAIFSLSHEYWVMLTIVTILKPVYNLTRIRNFQRVAGTLGGIVLAIGILYAVSSNTALVMILILCMLMAYSFLQVNYLAFVTFLTIYIVITFYFLNPDEFRELIGERLIDTFIGSVIAAITARFVFPVWQHHHINEAIRDVLDSNKAFFVAACHAEPGNVQSLRGYRLARNKAIVALTNLSDIFQHMLAEPAHDRLAYTHQFVIASHTLTGRISSLAPADVRSSPVTAEWMESIMRTFDVAMEAVDGNIAGRIDANLPDIGKLHPFRIIHSLANDQLGILQRSGTAAGK